jgi:hypothetical protein
MWDLDGKSPAHLTGYEPFVASIAAHTTDFGQPVLLINGDSHVYRSDNPLSPTAGCTTEATGPTRSVRSPGSACPGPPDRTRTRLVGSAFRRSPPPLPRIMGSGQRPLVHW